ncbi:Endonuclease YncB, thermonuclease family [Geopseudomonas sagittaria]|uniref:Endonuclease YncB, thermonuclease family n=1 Tax=Geopseudomonas sagittaria TaxID=1135990 RepID=A0A1I5PY36_9GAMM|nr:thermonuclease family protein [Pseudomonas sagittaria]SFP39048.1 Endonuclease YncB, thermonuclease family [Pseudomonas sagittaria]
MRSKFFAALLLALASPLALAADISCKVVGVYDGDTFTCLTDAKRQVKVRMAEIDTPESKQPYGTRSKQALSDLVFGKNVTLKVQDTDRYGRTVARADVGGTDVNAQLVSQGAAWVYRQYSKDKSLIRIEDKARAAKRGLWALPESERMPPWEWRKAGKDQRQAQRDLASITERRTGTGGGSAVGGSAGGSSYSCATRKTCGQMSSCSEARHQLEQCGNSRLDQDNDGVPCESLCR